MITIFTAWEVFAARNWSWVAKLLLELGIQVGATAVVCISTIELQVEADRVEPKASLINHTEGFLDGLLGTEALKKT